MNLVKGFSQAKRAQSWLDSKPSLSIVEDTILKLNKRLSKLCGHELDDCSHTIQILRSYMDEGSDRSDQGAENSNSVINSDVAQNGLSNNGIKKDLTFDKYNSGASAIPSDSSLSYEVDGTVRALSGKEKLSVFQSLKSQFGR
ncbi:hypothetical protein [Vibrio sp. 10N.239.312.D08]|uniref:hypothetical protein n=1 Tax=Vibrio sp. 10N.239.312.D08 TaxID=3229978 RepID=UPI0035511F42